MHVLYNHFFFYGFFFSCHGVIDDYAAEEEATIVGMEMDEGGSLAFNQYTFLGCFKQCTDALVLSAMMSVLQLLTLRLLQAFL